MTTDFPKLHYLNVPFNEKNIAKSNGARWDGDKKKWYVVGFIPDALKKYTQVREFKKCKSCGVSGAIGCYPFSTVPNSNYCDDCC